MLSTADIFRGIVGSTFVSLRRNVAAHHCAILHNQHTRPRRPWIIPRHSAHRQTAPCLPGAK